MKCLVWSVAAEARTLTHSNRQQGTEKDGDREKILYNRKLLTTMMTFPQYLPVCSVKMEKHACTSDS